MANVVAELFRQAARLNLEDPRRKGNLVEIPSPFHIVIAGDIHGNRTALAKIIAYAGVEKTPNRYLVLQEVIHGPLDPKTQQDRSIELLVRIARLKVSSPQQVLFVMGNHDLAQAMGNEIAKEGRGMCKSFADGIRFSYPDAPDEIIAAANEFLLSMPLAIRLPNRVWLSHSLPTPNRMDLAGTEILHRANRAEDLRRGGPVYEWTWGRDQTPDLANSLAAQLDVDFFVLGHRHTKTGCEPLTPRGVTLASDHEHGCVMEFTDRDQLTGENVMQFVRPVLKMG